MRKPHYLNAFQPALLEIAHAARYISRKFSPRDQEGLVMDGIFAWQASYLDAICETDDSLIEGRILEVQAALEQRLLRPIEREEALAIHRAAKGLETLRMERVYKTFGSNLISTPSQSTPQA
jgi:hypothetical protein